MKRIKVKSPYLTTRSEAESLAGDIAQLMITHETWTNEMNAEIQAIQKEYEPSLKSAEKEIKQKTALVQDWADRNPAEFSAKKSIDTVRAEFGYRTGTHRVEPLKDWTFAKILEKLQELGRKAFIRTKYEINREAIIEKRNTLTTEEKNKMGFAIVQDENFYITPKVTQSQPTVLTISQSSVAAAA